jgi:nicotinate-nucleotide pyrophosphorylase (carboxylating)
MQHLNDFIRRAFEEDVREGDHTSLACIPADAVSQAKLLVKDNGILAGIELAKAVFNYLDKDFKMEIFIQDGEAIKHGDIAFVVTGKAQLILQAERLVLNCMQRMSGIATYTKLFINELVGLNTKLLDTRKTTPTVRFLEKWAVRIAGGTNYREGLYDRIMIKDNHTDYCGDIQNAIRLANDYLQKKKLNLPITVEVRNLDELAKVLQVGQIQRIMLDNFDILTTTRAVKIINKRFEVEASGGIGLENIRSVALTGVDFISVGALTHSFKSLDLSLKKC